MKKIRLIVLIAVICFVTTGVNFAKEEYVESDYFKSVMEMIEGNYRGIYLKKNF